LTTGGLQVLAPLVEELRRERAGTNAGGVGLDDAQGAGDAGRTHTRAHASATGGRVGGGDERVGAVVHVQHGGLAALHQHALAAVQGLVEDLRGIDEHRGQAVRVGQEVLHDLLRLDRAAVVHLHQHLVLLIQRGFDLLAQDGLVQQILGADADAANLVLVGRADAAAGGADGSLAEEALGDAVDRHVVRGDELSVGGDAQVGGVRTAGLQAVDLLEPGLQVHHAAIANDGGRIVGEDAGWQELQLVLLPSHDDGVAGVVTAVGLDDVIDLATQDVRRLALALIAPLGTDNDDCCHLTSLVLAYWG